MKKLFITSIFILLCGIIQAQDYKTAIGVRMGQSQGISVKHFTSRYTAVEGIFSSRFGGYIVTGLFEFNNEMYEPGLNWFYGIGGHAGYFPGNRTNYPDWWENNPDDPYTILGADAILGMEYVFYNAPISIALDWKPSFNLIGLSGIWGDNVCLTIRYTLK